LSLQKIREETLIIDYYSGQERLLVMIMTLVWRWQIGRESVSFLLSAIQCAGEFY